MNTISGVLGRFPYRDDMPAIGRCAIHPGKDSRFEPTTLECPLCCGRLHHLMHGSGRVVAEVGRKGDELLVIIDPMPSTHRAVHCKACKVTFYQPLVVLSQPPTTIEQE